MNTIQLVELAKKNLCQYDHRSDVYAGCDVDVDCPCGSCDRCFHGNDELANAILEYIEEHK